MAMPRCASRSPAGRIAGAACCRPRAGAGPTVAIQAWPVAPPPAGHLDAALPVPSSVRRDPDSPVARLKTTSRADYVFARLEARRAGADDALFLTLDGHLSEGHERQHLPGPHGRWRDRARHPGARLRDPAGHDATWLLVGHAASGSAHEGWLSQDDLARADEAFVCSSVAGVLPVTGWAGRPIGDGRPGPWTGRARSDREAFIRGAPP